MPRILMVDDDLRQTSSMVDMLRKRGYEVITSLDPDSALEAVDESVRKKQSIDIMVLDVMMFPGSLGDDATDQGRETGFSLFKAVCDKLGKPIPTIVLTVIKSSEMKDRFLKENGIVTYVIKPITPKTLIRRVEEALGKH